MRRTEHLGARLLTTLGLAASVAYLVWRATASLAGSHLWLSLPALLVEIVALLGAAVLAWALWPLPQLPAVNGASAPAAAPLAATMDAVVRVQSQADHEVRATLLALRSVRGLEHVVVVDLSARPAVALLALEFQAVYAATDPADHNGVQVMVAAVRTPYFLLLDAGDVPTHDIIERLHAQAGPQVAVVQGLGTAFAPDSAEHGPGGRHELEFERRALNPALGARGCAAWTGSGSLVCTGALDEIEIDGGNAVGAHWRFGASLLAAGWRIASPAETVVVVHRTVDSDAEVRGRRVQRAEAARRTVYGRGGALRISRHTVRQRLALLAWAVRPLSGLRRALFVALLAVAVVAGAPPFQASTLTLVCLWLPAFLYTSLGLSLLSGWTLRPGDRTRASLQAMGPAWASLRATDARWAVHVDRARFGNPMAAPRRRPRTGVGVAGAVAVISLALVLRGVSERLTHTLPEVASAALMAMLMVSLWVLGLSLDVLRVLARRTQLRRSVRVVSSLAATLDDRAVSIVDVNALGAGLLSQTELGVG
ncbi:MAG: hypothetical protein Q7V88_17175, partial [Actinomycetota bacterium]|nr:hypothetical protein [Actinomycetota bacterium]